MNTAKGSFNPWQMFQPKFATLRNNLNSFRDEAYRIGKSISQSLSDGIRSVSITLPHIVVTSWTTTTYGNGGWFETPNFGVNWYKRGGLFEDPSIVGIGEKGAEAVLPLTDSKAMSRIADAITSNSSGFGISEDVLASAVTRGVVQAMMANQGNQQNPTFEVTVRTEDDEVLARAVERGRRKMDYRNNPTPGYGF